MLGTTAFNQTSEGQPVSDFGTMMRDLGEALTNAQYSGNVTLPRDVQDGAGALGKLLSSLGDFADNLDTTASLAGDIKQQLWQQANAREERARQMELEFRKTKDELEAEHQKQREHLTALIAEHSKVLDGINRRLGLLLAPRDHLVAARETLAVLREMPSDGAPRDVVDVLRRLDESLTGDHIEETSRKMDRLLRVVQEAEGFLLDADSPPDGSDDLAEALAEWKEAQ